MPFRLSPRPALRPLPLLLVVLVTIPAAALAQPKEPDDEEPRGWENATELSLVRTGGNAETQTFGFSNTLRRVWPAGRVRVRFDGVRSRTADDRFLALEPGVRFQPGALPHGVETTVVRPPVGPDVERYFVEGRFDRKIGERFLWHAGSSWDRNSDAGILNRRIAFGGVGNVWAEGEDLAFSTSYGFSYTDREELAPDPAKDDRFGGVRINTDYRQRFGSVTSIDNDVTMNVSLTDSSDYSINTASAVGLSMSEHLSLRVSVQWLYENEPAFEDAGIVAQVALLDPDGVPGSGDELFETVAGGGIEIDLGDGRIRKDRLDTILRTALVISF